MSSAQLALAWSPVTTLELMPRSPFAAMVMRRQAPTRLLLQPNQTRKAAVSTPDIQR